MKRHAGAYSREITVGASAAAKVGFHGATPTVQRAGAPQAAVADASQTISDPPTQAQVRALKDGLVAAVTLFISPGREGLSRVRFGGMLSTGL